MRLLFFAAITAALIVSVLAADPCLTDNGGCSFQCLSRGNDDVRCGCPCGFTSSDNGVTCLPDVPCDLDLLFLVDLRSTIDDSCLQFFLGPANLDFSQFEAWRDRVAPILSGFTSEDDTAQTNVGLQFFFQLQNPLTGANYLSSPTLTDAVTYLSAREYPECQHSNADFVTALEDALRVHPRLTGQPFRGPTGGRYDTNTTRYLVIFSHTFASPDVVDLMRARIEAMKDFDGIIFITREQRNDMLDEMSRSKGRLLACGDSTLPCENLLFIDQPNEFGVITNAQTIGALIQRDACRLRQFENVMFVSSLTCNGAMVIVLETCPLQGMTTEDLSFNDVACNVTQYATYSADGTQITIELEFGACGMTTDTDVGNTTTFSQQIRTRMFNAIQTLIDVDINATCSVVNDFSYNFQLRPLSNRVKANATAVGTFPLDLNLFPDNTFGSAFTEQATIRVGERVYGELSSVLPADLNLVLRSCVATPSPNPNDATSYTLADNGCPVDETFLFESEIINSAVRFSFEMFAFVSGNGTESALYINCAALVCEMSDASAACNPSCGKRKRRDVADEDEQALISKTIGPFRVVSKETHVGKKATDDGEAGADKDDDVDNDVFRRANPIQLVIPKAANSTFNFVFNFVIMAVGVFGIAYLFRSINRRLQLTFDLFHNQPGVVPYFHCAKHQVELTTASAGNGTVCRACAQHDASAQRVEGEEVTSEEEAPPEYRA
ncbi:uncharacterized protein LOC143469592 [Clavelina lepadiformis]|uniref:uncharacterized protein LOC143469592 n=1 Tax=Clavelina lepadiformis TaxID=159417 RepID=UPI0040425E81